MNYEERLVEMIKHTGLAIIDKYFNTMVSYKDGKYNWKTRNMVGDSYRGSGFETLKEAFEDSPTRTSYEDFISNYYNSNSYVPLVWL